MKKELTQKQDCILQDISQFTDINLYGIGNKVNEKNYPIIKSLINSGRDIIEDEDGETDENQKKLEKIAKTIQTVINIDFDNTVIYVAVAGKDNIEICAVTQADFQEWKIEGEGTFEECVEYFKEETDAEWDQHGLRCSIIDLQDLDSINRKVTNALIGCLTDVIDSKNKIHI